jgi:hypothetical protein
MTGRSLRHAITLFSLAATAVLPVAVAPAAAQDAPEPVFTLVLRDVPLADALGRLVQMSQMSLLYGPELDRSAPVYCSARDLPAEAVLRCIVESAGKDFYRLSSGTYVVIEPAEAPPRLGSLGGMVVCAETGEPLPFASVLLADASVGTAANDAGLFVLTNLLPGEHHVVASYVGYAPATASVEVLPDGHVRRRIALRPDPVAVYPVIVDGLQQRPPSSALGTSELLEEDRAAVPAGGPLAHARTSLGIATRPLTNTLHIQGGEAGEHQFQLDGVPVFEPLSLGQLFGAFSPLAVERVAVHKAGFGAAQGSFTAGVIELDHGLNPSHDATITADPYALNGRITERFSLAGRDVSVMAAGRYGLWEMWRVPSLDRLLRDWNDIDPLLMAEATGGRNETVLFSPHRRGSDLAFADLHAAARLQLTPFQSIRASGFHGASRVATDLFAVAGDAGAEPDRAALTRDGYRWTNTAGQVRYASLIGSRALGSLHVRASHHASRQRYAMIDQRDLAPATDFEQVQRDLEQALDAASGDDRGNLNRLTELAAEARLDLSLASGQLLEMGIEAAHVTHRFDIEGPFYRSLRSESEAWRVAAFAQDRRQLGRQVTLETGVRVTYVPDRGAVYAEPRAAMRYDGRNDRLGDYALRLATGVYRQFINQFDLTAVGPSALVPSVRFWLPVDHSLAPPLAVHTAAEALLAPAAGWELRAEAYYKHLPRLLALDYTALLDHGQPPEPHSVDQETFIAASRGFAYGGGIRVERAGERVRVRAGYDVSVSERTFPSRFDDRRQPTPWSEPHRALLAADVSPPAAASPSARRPAASGAGPGSSARPTTTSSPRTTTASPSSSACRTPGRCRRCTRSTSASPTCAPSVRPAWSSRATS